MSQEKIIRIMLGFLKEFGPAAFADYFVNYLAGPKSTAQATLTRAAELHAAGKVDEARSVLHSHPGGIGLADEMILLTDLLVLRRLKRISAQQALSLLASLNGLIPAQKKRFRLAHVHEEKAQIRHENLIELAKMNDAGRRATWNASGLFEPGPEEQFDNAADDVLRFLTAVHAGQRRAHHAATRTGFRHILYIMAWPIRVPFEAIGLW